MTVRSGIQMCEVKGQMGGGRGGGTGLGLVVLEGPVLDHLEVVEVLQGLLGEAALLVDVAGGVAGRHGDGPQLQQLLDGVDGHVAGPGHRHALALQASDGSLTSCNAHVFKRPPPRVRGGGPGSFSIVVQICSTFLPVDVQSTLASCLAVVSNGGHAAPLLDYEDCPAWPVQKLHLLRSAQSCPMGPRCSSVGLRRLPGLASTQHAKVALLRSAQLYRLHAASQHEKLQQRLRREKRSALFATTAENVKHVTMPPVGIVQRMVENEAQEGGGYLEALALCLQHLLCEVHQAVTSGLRPNQTASKRQPALCTDCSQWLGDGFLKSRLRSLGSMLADGNLSHLHLTRKGEQRRGEGGALKLRKQLRRT